MQKQESNGTSETTSVPTSRRYYTKSTLGPPPIPYYQPLTSLSSFTIYATQAALQDTPLEAKATFPFHTENTH